MDFPILIIWMSPLSFLGASGAIFHFYIIEVHVSKQNSPRLDTPFCLRMSQNKDARLIVVNNKVTLCPSNILTMFHTGGDNLGEIEIIIY